MVRLSQGPFSQPMMKDDHFYLCLTAKYVAVVSNENQKQPLLKTPKLKEGEKIPSSRSYKESFDREYP